MKTFVVRVYRSGDSPSSLVGVVEETGEGGLRSFRSIDELMGIFTGDSGRASGKGEPVRSRKKKKTTGL